MRFSVPKAFGPDGKLHCLPQILAQPLVMSSEAATLPIVERLEVHSGIPPLRSK